MTDTPHSEDRSVRGNAIRPAAVIPSALLTVPEYSDGTDAPDDTLFRDTSADELKYKNASGVVESIGSGGTSTSGPEGVLGGSFALGPSGSGRDTENFPVFVPDGATLTTDFAWLSKFKNGTTDANVELRLVDTSGNVESSITLSSSPAGPSGISDYTNTTGGPEVMYYRVRNTGGTDYSPSASASTADGIDAMVGFTRA